MFLTFNIRIETVRGGCFRERMSVVIFVLEEFINDGIYHRDRNEERIPTVVSVAGVVAENGREVVAPPCGSSYLAGYSQPWWL